MKFSFTLFFTFVAWIAFSQTYNSPESVEYDAARQRYIVANTNANNLQQVVPGSSPTLFKSGVTSPYGLVIVGDTVFVCAQGGYIKSYNLVTGNQVGNVNLGATFLNGICADKSGNIFATDFSSSPKRVFRYNIATQQFNVFATSNLTLNGILFDEPHNRLVVVTWGSNAPILGVSLIDSTITTLKTTTLSQCDGIAMDGDGNYYVSSWISSGKGIYFFDSAFVNAPIRVVSGLNNPADIFYNTLNDTLAVPNTGSNTVTFHGFPRPRPESDFDTVTVSNTKTICVLQNDLISGNAPLTLQSFSTPQLGNAVALGTCISYTASIPGNDTIEYTVCSVDTPSFCRTGTLIVTNIASGGNLAPIAMGDIVGTTQSTTIIVNVAINDIDAVTDTLCVVSIIGSNFFSLDTASCTNIIFTPDSSFIDSDTCWYVICDNGTPALCDTAILIVGLLPKVDFVGYKTSTQNSLFNCNETVGPWDSCALENTSIDSDSAVWIFRVANYDPYCQDSFQQITGDTIRFTPSQLQHQWRCWGGGVGGFNYLSVCLTVFNQFGSNSKCDTVCFIGAWENISEIPLSSLIVFPNPANSILTIDMEKNQEEITRNYLAIEIFNLFGEKQKSVLRKGTGKVVSLDVSDLPNGIYLATIISDKGDKRMLGKFTVSR